MNCLIRLQHAEDKKIQFKKDLIKYILAILIIVLGIQNSGKYIALAFFTFILVCGIVSLVLTYMKKDKDNSNSKFNHNEINEVEYYVDDNQE